MHNHEIQTIAIFMSQYKTSKMLKMQVLYISDIEYPMTLNDLSRLCDSIAERVCRRRQIPVRVPAGSA